MRLSRQGPRVQGLRGGEPGRASLNQASAKKAQVCGGLGFRIWCGRDFSCCPAGQEGPATKRSRVEMLEVVGSQEVSPLQGEGAFRALRGSTGT